LAVSICVRTRLERGMKREVAQTGGDAGRRKQGATGNFAGALE